MAAEDAIAAMGDAADHRMMVLRSRLAIVYVASIAIDHPSAALSTVAIDKLAQVVDAAGFEVRRLVDVPSVR